MSLIIKMDSIKSSGHLKQAIAYILNEAKTQGLSYSNCGSHATEIYDNFQFTKNIHRNRGNREGYHFKMSFSKDETITYENALNFAKDWAAGYLKGEYDFVTAVHTDRDHTHMHLIFNSVSRAGKKYRYERGDWEQIIKPLTNALAEKYHTGPLREKDPKLNYDPAKTWMGTVCQDIDACINSILNDKDQRTIPDTQKSQTILYEIFKERLQTDFGYTLREGISRDHGIYLSLTPPGKAKAIRTYRLPTGYQVNDINNRLGGYETITPDDLTEYKHTYDAKNSWFNSRSIFIPYDELSFYQKHFVRQMLTARHLYHGTNASKALKEQSDVAYQAIRGRVRLVCHYHVTSDEALEQAIFTLTERCNLRRATTNDKSALNELRRIQVSRLEQIRKEERHAEHTYR